MPQDPRKTLLILKKNSKTFLNKYLNSNELDCKCNDPRCYYTLFTYESHQSFNNTRIEFGKKIIINSAFRCINHNDKSAGKITSNHVSGDALDLMPEDLLDLDKLEIIAKKHFKFVLRYETFIHCDNRLFKI